MRRGKLVKPNFQRLHRRSPRTAILGQRTRTAEVGLRWKCGAHVLVVHPMLCIPPRGKKDKKKLVNAHHCSDLSPRCRCHELSLVGWFHSHILSSIRAQSNQCCYHKNTNDQCEQRNKRYIFWCYIQLYSTFHEHFWPRTNSGVTFYIFIQKTLGLLCSFVTTYLTDGVFSRKLAKRSHKSHVYYIVQTIIQLSYSSRLFHSCILRQSQYKVS